MSRREWFPRAHWKEWEDSNRRLRRPPSRASGDRSGSGSFHRENPPPALENRAIEIRADRRPTQPRPDRRERLPPRQTVAAEQPGLAQGGMKLRGDGAPLVPTSVSP